MHEAASPRGAVPLPAESRFLLACCRSATPADALVPLAAAIRDWPALLGMAQHHLLVPQLRRAVLKLPDEGLRQSVLTLLSPIYKEVSRRTLLQQAELKTLSTRFLVPQGIRHVVVKGLTMAARYHGDVMGRQGRDIDVLIDPDRLHELASELMRQGYQLSSAPFVCTDADLRAFCAMEYEVSLFSPRGVLIELHRQLDGTGSQYPVKASDLFALRTAVQVGDVAYPSLPTTELFIYISYHHSQHQWSRLHWLADLDALVAHETFDRAAVLHRAGVLGLGRLVRAVLSLHAVLIDGQPLHTVQDAQARQLIADCLTFVQAGSTPPEVLRREMSASAMGQAKVRARIFLYNWRANTRMANRLRYLMSLTRGSFADYMLWPLPPHWFWLYSLIRPVRWLLEYLPFMAKTRAPQDPTRSHA
jgi:hypothetical protein